MIDHVSIGVRDLAQAAALYEAALGAIGYRKLDVRPQTVGFGKRYSEFWLNQRLDMPTICVESGAHICLRAASTQAVDAFHAAAIAAGATSDGAPGVRSQYGDDYYAAFIRDRDGNRIEAVTFLSKRT